MLIPSNDRVEIADSQHFKKLVKRFDQLEIQLIKEQKENAALKEKLKIEGNNNQLYKAEIDYLKKQLDTPKVDTDVSIANDDMQIKQQAIHNTQLREKERENEVLRQQMQELQNLSSEHTLYLEFSALKKDNKMQQQMIEMQKVQIEQLEQHIQLRKL